MTILIVLFITALMVAIMFAPGCYAWEAWFLKSPSGRFIISLHYVREEVGAVYGFLPPEHHLKKERVYLFSTEEAGRRWVARILSHTLHWEYPLDRVSFPGKWDWEMEGAGTCTFHHLKVECTESSQAS